MACPSEGFETITALLMKRQNIRDTTSLLMTAGYGGPQQQQQPGGPPLHQGPPPEQGGAAPPPAAAPLPAGPDLALVWNDEQYSMVRLVCCNDWSAFPATGGRSMRRFWT